jgi:integrase
MNLQTFRDWLLVNGASQASADTHVVKVASYFSQYRELTQDNLNAYLASKLNVWEGSSFNLFINAINHYKKFLKLEIEVPSYHKTNKRVKDYLTESDLNDVYAKMPLIFDEPEKPQAIFTLLFELGLRPKEILQLKREHFDFENKILLITKTKVYRDRQLPLSNELCDILPIIFHKEEEGENAFNLTRDSLRYIFRRINDVMPMKKKLYPYLMRHSYAHNLISKGIKLTSLQVLMGHSSPLTTLNYLGVSEKEAIDEARIILNKRRKK